MRTLVEIKIGTVLLIVALLCSCALFSGCTNPVDVSVDYENARRAAIEAWEELIGPVSRECYDRSVNAIVAESDIFPETCIVPDGIGLGDHIIGCYLPVKDLPADEVISVVDKVVDTKINVSDLIFIYEGRTELQKLDTAVHEFAHLLHRCEFDDGRLLDMEMVAKCTVQLIEEGKPGDECWMPGDYFHIDERVWDRYGLNTVEALGCANLEL